MILLAGLNGMGDAPVTNVVEFGLFGDAPAYEFENGGVYSDVDFGGAQMSKLTKGTIILYFKPDKSRISVKQFSLEFDRVCYTPSGDTYATQIVLYDPFIQLQRDHYRYGSQVGNKNQIDATYGRSVTVYNGASLVEVPGLTEGPIVIDENQPFYDTLYRIKLVGDSTKLRIYVNGVLKAEEPRGCPVIQCVRIQNETNNAPIGARNFRIEYR